MHEFGSKHRQRVANRIVQILLVAELSDFPPTAGPSVGRRNGHPHSALGFRDTFPNDGESKGEAKGKQEGNWFQIGL